VKKASRERNQPAEALKAPGGGDDQWLKGSKKVRNVRNITEALRKRGLADACGRLRHSRAMLVKHKQHKQQSEYKTHHVRDRSATSTAGQSDKAGGRECRRKRVNAAGRQEDGVLDNGDKKKKE